MLVADFKNLLTTDASALYLFISNVITIVLGLFLGWSVLGLMWVYWFQSIVIGFFHVLKLLLYGERNRSRISVDKLLNEELDKNPAENIFRVVGNIFLALFFAFHYGIFHLVYFVFLIVFTFGGFGAESVSFAALPAFSLVDIIPFVFLGFLFFANHLFSFIKHLGSGESVSFGEPYARILPMHLTIIFGTIMMVFLGGGVIGNAFVLVFFGALKTIADITSHAHKHGLK